MSRSGRGIHRLTHQQQTIGTNTMAKSSDEILVNTDGRSASDGAKFGRGMQTLEQSQDAIDKRNASTNASSPRKYGER
jgi:hypothetical protein